MRVICGLIAGFAMLSGGCAFVDNRVNLAYQAPGPSMSLAHGRVAVLPVESNWGATKNSKGRLVIGSVRNTLGAKTADVLTDDSPEEWVRGALIAELRARGFEAVATPAGSGEAMAIASTLLELSNQTEINFWTVGDQVTIRAKFRVMRGPSPAGEFESTARSDIRNGISSEGAKQKAYGSALELLMKDAAPRLEALLAAGPAPSTPVAPVPSRPAKPVPTRPAQPASKLP